MSVHKSESFEFVFCVLGIYAAFLTWSILQERVTTTPYLDQKGDKHFYRHIFVLNCMQALTASLVGWVYSLIRRERFVSMSWDLIRRFSAVGFLSTIASPFGYASLQHIDYPTMILGKSCKLVPVMFAHVLIFRQRFPLYKYASVVLITLGVSLFMLQHDNEAVASSKGRASLYGLTLLTINLVIDGLTNASQDQIFTKYRSISGTQMMVFMNLASCFYMAVYLMSPWTTELYDAISFVQRHPTILRDIGLFSICGGLGQIFIFHTLSRFGSMSLVTVTVTRKLFTILLSVVWFNHHLGAGQWMSVGLVFFGIGVETYLKPSKVTKVKALDRGANGVSGKETSSRQVDLKPRASPRLRGSKKKD